MSENVSFWTRRCILHSVSRWRSSSRIHARSVQWLFVGWPRNLSFDRSFLSTSRSKFPIVFVELSFYDHVHALHNFSLSQVRTNITFFGLFQYGRKETNFGIHLRIRHRSRIISIEDLVSLQRKFLISRLSWFVQRRPHHAVSHPRNENTRRMPHRKKVQKEALRTASCTIANLQRAQNVTVTSEGKSVKGAVPGQGEGKDWGSRECNHSSKKKGCKKQCSSPNSVEAKSNGAWENQSILFHWTLGKKVVESLGGQRMTNHSNLSLDGCKAFYLTESSAFRIDNPQGRIDFGKKPRDNFSKQHQTNAIL